MNFILYENENAEVSTESHGRVDYGYRSALKSFAAALEGLGTIDLVRDVHQIPPILKSCDARGVSCLLLSFAPPDKTPVISGCQTVPVVAWGFSAIPDDEWDDDSSIEWRSALARAGLAITLSGSSARALAAAMHGQCQVFSVPVPVVPRTAREQLQPAMNRVALPLSGSVIDSTAIELSADILSPQYRREQDRTVPLPARQESEKSLPARKSWFGGFGRGSQTASQNTSENPAVDIAPLSRPRPDLAGVIYTAAFDPTDRRQNWIDMVTAFCMAFRDTRNATLVLLMNQPDLTLYESRLVQTLCQVSPFMCRVVALQGYPDGDEYKRLIGGTSFYVNASGSEDACLPLMDFMACGVPAIAPAHTAMADFIDADVAFVLRMSLERDAPPRDPREIFRTPRYRLDWESLLDAYRASYALVEGNPGAYSSMCDRSRRRMQDYCSIGVVASHLRHVFEGLSGFGDSVMNGGFVAAAPASATMRESDQVPT